MVLRGDDEGFAPPFDSALYGASYSPETPGTEYTIEYSGCEALVAVFSTSERVTDLLPEGIQPASSPPQATLFVGHYPFSTVGEYHEVLWLIEVEDLNGERTNYLPYIYVTNDAAMAAGRELAGAPKKMAHIDLGREGDSIQGTLERPTGKRLLTVTAKPEQRVGEDVLESVLSGDGGLLSVRHLPPIEGGDGLTQLVKWYTRMDFETGPNGRPKVWTGPIDVAYDTHSAVDPVDRIPIDELLVGAYAQFDMVLGVTEVQEEWRP